jgi:hypothetical protein
MSLWKKNKLTLKGHLSIAPCICGWKDPPVKGSPPLCCGIAVDEAASWVDACASNASSWSAPNDSWLLLSLLKELAMILCSQCAIDFSLGIYTNLHKKKQFWFLKNNSAAPPLYNKLPEIFNPANRQHICHKPIDFIQFLPTILNNSIS